MSTSRGEGTAAYRDPLSFNDRSYKRGKKSDIFSLGVVLWEISSGKLPCEGCTQSFEVFKYRQQGYRDPPFDETPEAYIMLYSKCWSEDSNNRPLCEEIYCCLNILLNNESGHLLKSELSFQSQIGRASCRER